ncbi:4'-phosphopantetheinyl transferase family protein [Hansschlegelia plantiphila]|uniref:4'-phosphopantetheinyl transferase family protein n=1 Tax=Hansschlegelia plantiphila TaxID=374655 RepID=UPI0022F2A22E|nr:4'-phosphopantetheinyl transferase superfamily protein [Hansschlegelia plantiphila]
MALRLAKPEALDASELERFERLLSEDERGRWRGFRSREAAAQFLVGRGLLRSALSDCADITPERWRFGADAHGKPRIASPTIPQDLRFNLSHTRSLVALAVCEGFEVGVDVEEIRPLDIAELAPLALAPEERSAFEKLAPDERLERFYTLWTLKEAYAKARGFGLSLPFPEIVFEPCDGGWRLARAPQDAASWTFLTMRPTDRHRLAIAAEGPAVTVAVIGYLGPPAAAAGNDERGNGCRTEIADELMPERLDA